MIFTPDDFAFSFNNPDQPGITGLYNNLFPSVNMQRNESEAIKYMITAHEKAHADLNQNTLTGIYLQYIGQLAGFVDLDTATKEKLLSLISKLVAESRICHETYATFVGMNAYALIPTDVEKINPLEGSGEYSWYYKLGCEITQSIQGVICKEAFLGAFCSYCFNSVSLVDELFAHPLDFSLARLQSNSLPDKRLQSLLNDIGKLDAQSLIDSYIEYVAGKPGNDILIRDRANELVQGELQLTHDNLLIIEGLHFFVIEALNESLSEDFGLAYSFDAPEIKIPELTDALRKHFPKEVEELALGHFETNLDNRQKLLLSYEGEKIQLWDKKPICMVIRPEQLDDNAKDVIYDERLNDHHIMLQCMIPNFLREQYEFIREEDLAYILTLMEPCVVLRYVQQNEEGEIIVYLIPFESTAQLVECLADMPQMFPVYGLFYYTAYLQCIDASNNWIPFFKENCLSYYMINDLSLFLFLEDFKNQTINAYTWTEISIAGIDYAFLFFMVNNVLHVNTEDGVVERENGEWMIVPGTMPFVMEAHQYIQDNFPDVNFTEDYDFIAFHEKYSKLCVEHIFTEDYIWGFKSKMTELIIKKLYKYDQHF